MNKMKNGWHKIKGYDMYVEDGYVTAVTEKNLYGCDVPKSLWKRERDGHKWACNSVKVSDIYAGRAGVV